MSFLWAIAFGICPQRPSHSLFFNFAEHTKLLIHTSTQYSFIRYLAAKKTVDDRALNAHVWNTLVNALPVTTPERPLRVLEVGAGIGTMVERVVERKLLKYAHYKADKALQRAHAAAPWIVTWDDHEVENNYANDVAEDESIDPVAFLVRRANAYQAYYENMPLRKTSLPRGPDLQLYRRARFGQLAEFNILDTRQYRTNQPNRDGICDVNDAALSPDNSMLGAKQRAWLEAALVSSPATWNVLAQQVMMGTVDVEPGDERRYFMDQWPGYLNERQPLLKLMADRQVQNPIVLTGDYHANWVNNLRLDDRRSDTPVVATEFVGTSISSEANGARFPKYWQETLAENPCVRFLNQERGYIRCTVTPDEWRSDFRTVPYVTRPGAPITTRATFVVESGRPGAEQA